MTHRTVSLRFPKAENISPSDLRRLVNKCNEWSDPLLHNHSEDENAYPKVQYRSIQARPGIWAIDEGIDSLEAVVDKLEQKLGSPTVHFDEFEPGKNLHLLKYHCQSFLPFNEDNYEKWKYELSHIKRMALLEGVLKDQLGNFYQGIGYDIQGNDILCILHSVAGPPKTVSVDVSGREVKFLGFDIFFYTDLLLPEGLGLGKCKAKGNGITLAREVH